MTLRTFAIPDDLDFSDLKLRRLVTGEVEFDTSVIERICAASDISTDVFLNAPEDNLATLIVTWYRVHRVAGGRRDPVAEELIAEIRDGDYE